MNLLWFLWCLLGIVTSSQPLTTSLDIILDQSASTTNPSYTVVYTTQSIDYIYPLVLGPRPGVEKIQSIAIEAASTFSTTSFDAAGLPFPTSLMGSPTTTDIASMIPIDGLGGIVAPSTNVDGNGNISTLTDPTATTSSLSFDNPLVPTFTPSSMDSSLTEFATSTQLDAAGAPIIAPSISHSVDPNGNVISFGFGSSTRIKLFTSRTRQTMVPSTLNYDTVFSSNSVASINGFTVILSRSSSTLMVSISSSLAMTQSQTDFSTTLDPILVVATTIPVSSVVSSSISLSSLPVPGISSLQTDAFTTSNLVLVLATTVTESAMSSTSTSYVSATSPIQTDASAISNPVLVLATTVTESFVATPSLSASSASATTLNPVLVLATTITASLAPSSTTLDVSSSASSIEIASDSSVVSLIGTSYSRVVASSTDLIQPTPIAQSVSVPFVSSVGISKSNLVASSTDSNQSTSLVASTLSTATASEVVSSRMVPTSTILDAVPSVTNLLSLTMDSLVSLITSPGVSDPAIVSTTNRLVQPSVTVDPASISSSLNTVTISISSTSNSISSVSKVDVTTSKTLITTDISTLPPSPTDATTPVTSTITMSTLDSLSSSSSPVSTTTDLMISTSPSPVSSIVNSTSSSTIVGSVTPSATPDSMVQTSVTLVLTSSDLQSTDTLLTSSMASTTSTDPLLTSSIASTTSADSLLTSSMASTTIDPSVSTSVTSNGVPTGTLSSVSIVSDSSVITTTVLSSSATMDTTLVTDSVSSSSTMDTIVPTDSLSTLTASNQASSSITIDPAVTTSDSVFIATSTIADSVSSSSASLLTVLMSTDPSISSIPAESTTTPMDSIVSTVLMDSSTSISSTPLSSIVSTNVPTMTNPNGIPSPLISSMSLDSATSSIATTTFVFPFTTMSSLSVSVSSISIASTTLTVAHLPSTLSNPNGMPSPFVSSTISSDTLMTLLSTSIPSTVTDSTIVTVSNPNGMPVPLTSILAQTTTMKSPPNDMPSPLPTVQSQSTAILPVSTSILSLPSIVPVPTPLPSARVQTTTISILPNDMPQPLPTTEPTLTPTTSSSASVASDTTSVSTMGGGLPNDVPGPLKSTTILQTSTLQTLTASTTTNGESMSTYFSSIVPDMPPSMILPSTMISKLATSTPSSVTLSIQTSLSSSAVIPNMLPAILTGSLVPLPTNPSIGGPNGIVPGYAPNMNLTFPQPNPGNPTTQSSSSSPQTSNPGSITINSNANLPSANVQTFFNSLTPPVIAGIIIGTLVGLAIIGGFIYAYVKNAQVSTLLSNQKLPDPEMGRSSSVMVGAVLAPPLHNSGSSGANASLRPTYDLRIPKNPPRVDVNLKPHPHFFVAGPPEGNKDMKEFFAPLPVNVSTDRHESHNVTSIMDHYETDSIPGNQTRQSSGSSYVSVKSDHSNVQSGVDRKFSTKLEKKAIDTGFLFNVRAAPSEDDDAAAAGFIRATETSKKKDKNLDSIYSAVASSTFNTLNFGTSRKPFDTSGRPFDTSRR